MPIDKQKDNQRRNRLNSLLKGVILPSLAIGESVLTKGRSPGLASLGVLSSIQEREQHKQDILQKKKDAENEAIQEAFKRRIGEAQLKDIEGKRSKQEEIAASIAILRKKLELAGTNQRKIQEALFQHKIRVDPEDALGFSVQREQFEAKEKAVVRREDKENERLKLQADRDADKTKRLFDKTERLIRQREFQNETAVTKEYNSNSKDYNILKNQFKSVEESVNNPSPAGDISLVFAYMKLLDPRSTVREGEAATVQNAAGVPERVRNMWNKAIEGEFLDPLQRKDILNKTMTFYYNGLRNQLARRNNITERANNFNLDANRIISGVEIYIPSVFTKKMLDEIGIVSPGLTTGATAQKQKTQQGVATELFQGTQQLGDVELIERLIGQ